MYVRVRAHTCTRNYGDQTKEHTHTHILSGALLTAQPRAHQLTSFSTHSTHCSKHTHTHTHTHTLSLARSSQRTRALTISHHFPHSPLSVINTHTHTHTQTHDNNI